MEQMEDKDRHMVTESTNRKKLLEEVEHVSVSLQFKIVDDIRVVQYHLDAWALHSKNVLFWV